MLNERRVVITGGAGFIGSHLADECVARGWQVTILDDLSTGRLENIQHLLTGSSSPSPTPSHVTRQPSNSSSPSPSPETYNLKPKTCNSSVTFLPGSIADLGLLQTLFQGADYVFHLAAIASVQLSLKDPARVHETNLTGALNVLTAARDNQVKKVVFASSAAVYGDVIPSLSLDKSNVTRQPSNASSSSPSLDTSNVERPTSNSPSSPSLAPSHVTRHTSNAPSSPYLDTSHVERQTSNAPSSPSLDTSHVERQTSNSPSPSPSLPPFPIPETTLPNPQSPYAVTKLAAEYYCRVFSQVYGLPTVCLRYFNVFGTRQNPASDYAAVIPIFIEKLRRGQPPVIYGDGLQTRDFIYVADVVSANLLAAQSPACGVFNIGSGVATTLNHLLETLRTLQGGENPEPVYAPSRPGDIRHSLADISQAQTIGYTPRYTLSAALRQMLSGQ
jgi:nucleoside-diphosphate-sugar epimerase